MNRTALCIILCLVVVALAAPTKSAPTSTGSTADHDSGSHHHRSLNKASVSVLTAVVLGSYAYCIICWVIDCLCPLCCMDIKEEKYSKKELAERNAALAGRPSSSTEKDGTTSRGRPSKPSKVASFRHKNKQKNSASKTK